MNLINFLKQMALTTYLEFYFHFLTFNNCHYYLPHLRIFLHKFLSFLFDHLLARIEINKYYSIKLNIFPIIKISTCYKDNLYSSSFSYYKKVFDGT